MKTTKQPPFIVEVFAHKGLIICAPSRAEENPVWYPTSNDGRMGCVLGNSKRYLKISQEALKLLQTITIGRDAIGDIDWWKCDDVRYAFSWFGGIFRVINPKDATTARDFRTYPDQCTVIPNNPTKEMIAGALKAEANQLTWKKLFSVNRKPKKTT